MNGFTAALLCAIAFAATAGGEFVREGVRKPYSIRQVLYSNSLRPDELDDFARPARSAMILTRSRWPDLSQRPATRRCQVYRFQCSVCHTYEGANGLLDLTRTWTLEQKRLNIAHCNAPRRSCLPSREPGELEALVQVLSWRRAGMPREWPSSHDPATLEKIQGWLDEVGTRPGRELTTQGGMPAANDSMASQARVMPKERRR